MVLAMLGMVISVRAAEPQAGSVPTAQVTSPDTYSIGDAIPGKRVAVMNLKVEGEYSEQVKDWLPALIEDRLLCEGWTLVVRGERMQHIQEEQNMPGIKPETQLPKDELLGATAFVELTARIQVRDIQGLVGYKWFTFGDYARATVDLNGQVVDPATGVLKSSVSVGGSASGLKTGLVISINSDWRVGAGGYNLKGIRESLVGKAADEAAGRMIAVLQKLYPTIPGQKNVAAMQPSSTTVRVEASEATILLDLPDASSAGKGDHYGIYRGDELVAEVEVLRTAGTRAEAKVITQTKPIRPTDTARRMPMVIGTE